MAALRRHPAFGALLIVYVIGAGIAPWLAPVLGGIMLAALGLVGFVLLLPSLFTIDLHGAGSRYRDESSPTVRRKRRV